MNDEDVGASYELAMAAKGRVVQFSGSWDPELGVAIGWQNSNPFQMLAILDIAKKAVMDQLAPSSSTPIAQIQPTKGAVSARTVARKVS